MDLSNEYKGWSIAECIFNFYLYYSSYSSMCFWFMALSHGVISILDSGLTCPLHVSNYIELFARNNCKHTSNRIYSYKEVV